MTKYGTINLMSLQEAKPGTSWHELGMASDIDKTKPDMMDLWDKDKDLATDEQKRLYKIWNL